MPVTTHAYDPDVIRCPWEFDAQLRREAPVYFDETAQAFLISSYELVTAVIQDPDNFSSRVMPKMVSKAPFPPEVLHIYAGGFPTTDALLVTDGDQHIRHRRIITKAFSRKRLNELTPHFEKRIAALFNQAACRGRMSVRKDFADLVPLIMTQHQLRILEDDMPRVIAWSHILSSGFGGADKPLEQLRYEAEQTLLFQQYFQKRIREEIDRLTATGQGTRDDDLLTLLAQSVLDPTDPMDMAEAISFLFILLPATHDTTTAAMTASLHRYVASPEAQREAREDPGSIRRLIDETMRHESPVRQFWRLATNDVTLGGVSIPAGSWLLLRVSSANRDDATFADASRFDARRPFKRPYLTFGTGIHMCVGRPWALHIIALALRHFAASGKVFRFIDGENDFDHVPNLLSAPYTELEIAIDDPGSM